MAMRLTEASRSRSASAMIIAIVSACWTFRAPSEYRAVIPSSAAACAACSAAVAPPPGTDVRAASLPRKLPMVSSRTNGRLPLGDGTVRRRGWIWPRQPGRVEIRDEHLLHHVPVFRMRGDVGLPYASELLRHRRDLLSLGPVRRHRDLRVDVATPAVVGKPQHD